MNELVHEHFAEFELFVVVVGVVVCRLYLQALVCALDQRVGLALVGLCKVTTENK